MTIEVRLVQMGGRYERAHQKNDFTTLMMLEKELDKICSENPELWIAAFVVRGRNKIRKHRGLELIHV